MFLIIMGTHFSQSSLQLLSDSIQISKGFIPIKTFCIKCIYYKCVYPTNAFIPQMHLSYKCIFITINLFSKASDFSNYFNVLFIIYYLLAFNFI